MSKLEQIESCIIVAMKAKESFRLGVLRLIKSELKNKEIEQLGKLSDADFTTVLSRMVKQRRESADQYRKGGREDLAESEENEVQLISRVLTSTSYRG